MNISSLLSLYLSIVTVLISKLCLSIKWQTREVFIKLHLEDFIPVQNWNFVLDVKPVFYLFHFL
jgi:hypothetical protein